MQYHLRYNNPLLQTVLITSLLYASLHFIHPPRVAESAVIGWSTGRELLMATFHQYRDVADIADSFVALFFAGLLLSLVRERSGNIALCIGIHAGWVLSIKLLREITDAATDSPTAILIGSYDGVIGWAAAGLLAAVTLGYWKIGPKPQP